MGSESLPWGGGGGALLANLNLPDTPVLGRPGTRQPTFLPGQGDDVRRALAHDLGDVHGAVDAASDGDGPEHSLGLQLGTQPSPGHQGAGPGRRPPPRVPGALPGSEGSRFPYRWSQETLPPQRKGKHGRFKKGRKPLSQSDLVRGLAGRTAFSPHWEEPCTFC